MSLLSNHAIEPRHLRPSAFSDKVREHFGDELGIVTPGGRNRVTVPLFLVCAALPTGKGVHPGEVGCKTGRHRKN